MKFFVPGARDQAEADGIWQAVAQYNRTPHETPFNARVQAVAFSLNGTQYTVAVGEPAPDYFGAKAGTIVAILDNGSGFLICATHRGAVNGSPVLVGDNLNPTVAYFDA